MTKKTEKFLKRLNCLIDKVGTNLEVLKGIKEPRYTKGYYDALIEVKNIWNEELY